MKITCRVCYYHKNGICGKTGARVNPEHHFCNDILVPKKEKTPDEKVIELIKRGLTLSEISKKTGMPYGTVWYRVKKLGLSPKKTKYCHKGIIDDQVIPLMAERLSRSEIARRLEVSKTPINKRINRLIKEGYHYDPEWSKNRRTVDNIINLVARVAKIHKSITIELPDATITIKPKRS